MLDYPWSLGRSVLRETGHIREAARRIGLRRKIMIKAAERPAWLRRDLTTDSQRRSAALAGHLERLLAGGETIHSAGGDSMAFLIDGLERAKKPYVIEASPGRGYKIRTEAAK